MVPVFCKLNVMHWHSKVCGERGLHIGEICISDNLGKGSY